MTLGLLCETDNAEPLAIINYELKPTRYSRFQYFTLVILDVFTGCWYVEVKYSVPRCST